MKRKFSLIIAVLLSFVMCFALFACNKDNKNGTDEGNLPDLSGTYYAYADNQFVYFNVLTVSGTDWSISVKGTQVAGGTITGDSTSAQFVSGSNGASATATWQMQGSKVTSITLTVENSTVEYRADDGYVEKDVDSVLASLSANLNKLVESTAYSFDLGVNYVTDGDNGFAAAFTVERRGDQLRVTWDGSPYDMIFDFSTGYMYNGREDGYIFSQFMPQYYMDGLRDMIAGEQADINSVPADLFTYDAYEQTLSFELDLVQPVNDVLAFFQDAYADEISLKDLLDSIIVSVSDGSFDLESAVDFIVALGVTGKDYTVGEFVDMIGEAAGDFDVNEIVTSLLDEEKYAVIKEMEVGQLLEGLVAIVDALPEAMQNGMSSEALVGLVMGSLFPEEQYDTAELEADLGRTFEFVLAMLDAFKFNEIIDMAAAKEPFIGILFEEDFAIEELAIGYEFVFDGDDLVGINGSAKFSHNYEGDMGPDAYIFDDNGYEFDFSIEFGNFTDSYTPWVIDEFSEKATVDFRTVRSVSLYDSDEDVVVYLETGDIELDVVSIEVLYCYDHEDNSYFYTFYQYEQGDIVYDAQSKTLTVKRSLIDDVIEIATITDINSVIDVRLNVDYEGEPAIYTVSFYEFNMMNIF